MADESAKYGETLNQIVQFLRDQGFNQAEQSLLSEIQGRLDSSSADQILSSQVPDVPQSSFLQHDTLSFAASAGQNVAQIGSATVLSGGTGSGPYGLSSADPFAPQYYTGAGAELDHATMWLNTQGHWRNQEDWVDEYVDDDDVGYCRHDIPGQDAFIAREIDMSDDDGTGRGNMLYHKALYEMQTRESQRVNKYDKVQVGGFVMRGDQNEGSGSLASEVGLYDTRKPPYATWGADPAVGTEPQGVSQASAGGRAKADAKVVVLDPVQPRSGRSPRSGTQSVPSRTSSDLGLVLPPNMDVVDVLEVPEIPSISSEKSSPAKAGTPSHAGTSGPTAPATPPSSGERAADAAKKSSSKEGVSGEGHLGSLAALLDPLALLDKVTDDLLGRNRGDTSPSQGEGLPAGIGQAGPQSPEAAPVPTDADDVSREAGLGRGPQLLPLATPSGGTASEQDDSENFTFCVTPPSEPAAPSALFGTWSSMSKLHQSNLSSAHSSGYQSEDDTAPSKLGSSAPPAVEACLASSTRAEDLVTAAAMRSMFAEASFPSSSEQDGILGPVLQADAVQLAGDEVPPATPSPHAASKPGGMGRVASSTTSEVSSRGEAGDPGDPSGTAEGSTSYKAIDQYKPLDHSMSLPPMGLVNIREALKRPTAEARGVFEPEPLPDIPEGMPVTITSPGPLGEVDPSSLQSELPLPTPAPQEAVLPTPAPTVQLECGTIVYEYDPAYIERRYEILNLKVIHRRRRTGFEETKDFPIRVNDLIAGRYQVMDFLGSAAFSKAVQALDIKTGMLVCLKIIKNNKDYLDQSLDEIKLLKHVNEADPNDEYGMLRLFDFFYYKEHLFLVCELLRANLYEFQKYNRDQGNAPYFTLPRVQKIARQVLHSLSFLHALGLIHSDLKPENILIKSYSRCEVKVIDLGSSCYTSDQLSSYVQSRSYRAPEVILGLPYDQKIDIWSLGCIIAELLSGYVLFQNDSLATLLARLEGILGPVPRDMLRRGRYAHRFYTRSGVIFERSPRTGQFDCLKPKRTSLRKRVPEADEGCLSFMHYLLSLDPSTRPTAAQALHHPWLSYNYGPIPTN